jgi:hypothetical protein
METSAVIALSLGAALVIVAVAILIARSSENAGKKPKKRPCGGCRRVMAPDWEKCLFCGWVVPAPIAQLEFLSGPLTGQTFPLHEEVTTIGSVAGNAILLADPAVSRKHIGIRRSGTEFEFADLGSTNGVYVNGHRMPRKHLVSGDILRVGNTEMVFRLE